MQFKVYRDFNGSGYSQIHVKYIGEAGESVRFTKCAKNGQSDVNVTADTFYNLTTSSTTATVLFFPFNNQLGAGDTTTHSFFPFIIKLAYNTANPGHIEYYDSDGAWHKVMFYNIGNSEGTATTIDVMEEGGGSGFVMSVSGNNVSSVVYNGNTYVSFPASIPLDPDVTIMSINGETYNVTVKNAGNLAKIKVGDTEYTVFPASVSITEDTEINGYGKNDPVITINYTNTDEPIIT